MEGASDMKSFDTTWETIHATEEWGKYPSEPVIRFVARNYYKCNRKQIKFLDYCCGAGSNTWYLAREGFDTYAFDGSESAIKKVQNRFEEEGLSANLRVRDALDMDYADEFFDCVIDSASIYANRLDCIIKMYEEIYRMLKPGGKIFTIVFSKNTTGYGTGTEIEKDTFTNITCGSLSGRGTAHFFDEQELSNLLEKVGFKNILVDLYRFTDKGNVVENIMLQALK